MKRALYFGASILAAAATITGSGCAGGAIDQDKNPLDSRDLRDSPPRTCPFPYHKKDSSSC
jgi:hypothetical protein